MSQNWTQAQANAYEARRLPAETERKTLGAVAREAELHTQIIEECNRRGWIPFHGSMAHRAFRVPGEPDFIVVADVGRVFMIEAKTGTGKLSTEQQAIAAWAKRLGHTVHVCRNIEQFMEAVNPQPTPQKL